MFLQIPKIPKTWCRRLSIFPRYVHNFQPSMWPTKEFPFLWFCIWIMFVILFNSKTVPCWITWSMTLFKACCDVVMLNPIQLQMYFLIIGWLYRYKGNPNREVTSQINSLLWILHTFILLGRLFTYIYKLIPLSFSGTLNIGKK